MAMFTPPPPKTLPPMPVVAPYVSDADTRKKLWELGMRHHLKALEGVTSATDQSDPSVGDAAVRKVRERARDFVRDEMRRDIIDGNKQLVSRLKEIVRKPTAVSPPTGPHHNARYEMLRRDRQLRQQNIQNENKFLVQRILSVKSSVDISSLEKDYWRHRKDVSRLQQIPLPKLHQKESKLPRKPKRKEVEVDLPARTPSAGSFRPVRSLPLPMPKSSSTPVLSLPVEVKKTKRKDVKKELQRTEDEVVESANVTRSSSQEMAAAEYLTEEMTHEALEVHQYVSSLVKRISKQLSEQEQQSVQPKVVAEAFDVSGYLGALFERCAQRAQDFEFLHEQVVESANVTRSSFLRSQEIAAAEYLAEEMTHEALEAFNAEAASLMNDTQATWSSLPTGAWWQAGL